MFNRLFALILITGCVILIFKQLDMGLELTDHKVQIADLKIALNFMQELTDQTLDSCRITHEQLLIIGKKYGYLSSSKTSLGPFTIKIENDCVKEVKLIGL